MWHHLEHYVRVPATAAELRRGDQVLLEGWAEPWRVGRLEAAAWGRTPAVISLAPNREYHEPRLGCARPGDPVTLLVSAEVVTTARPPGARNPLRPGWDTDPGGYDVVCGCGWNAGAAVEGDRVFRAMGMGGAQGIRHHRLLAPGPHGCRPAAVLVRLPEITLRYVYRHHRLVQFTPETGGGPW
jgi:hypothetical protein